MAGYFVLIASSLWQRGPIGCTSTHYNSTTNEWQKEQDLKWGVCDANDDPFVIDPRHGGQSLLETDNGSSEDHPDSDYDLPGHSQSLSHNSKPVTG